MNIAVIENGIVENIIVCESVRLAETLTNKQCVEYTNANPAHIGLGYNKGVFEQYPIVDVSATQRQE